MNAFDDPVDFCREVDEAKSCIIQRVIFWPKKWNVFNPPKDIIWKWKSVPFSCTNETKVPNDKHGLYSFVICPQIAKHPHYNLVLYIGKAEDMTLRARFKSYFQDMKRVKRPPICYHLNKYSGFINFCFTPVSNRDDIKQGEDSLLSAFLPPCNTDFPAEVSEIIRGIK
jgi:hypothetical protein